MKTVSEVTAVKEVPAVTRGHRSASDSLLIVGLSIVFLAVALGFIVLSTSGNIAAAWLVLIVPFCLSIVGSLVLFHFLASSAQIEHSSYKVGGAVAGFVVLFGLLTHAISQPLQSELALYQLVHSSAKETLVTIATADETIRNLNNPVINAIAASTLNTARDTFTALAKGTILSIDTWIQRKWPTFLKVLGGSCLS
jgi:hypothetical protein